MFRLIFKLFSSLYENSITGIDKIANSIVLKYKKVKYTSFPVIRGRISIKSKGEIILGHNVRFNCNTHSVNIGIYKTCTIYVNQNARLEIGDHSGFSGVSIHCNNHIKIGKYVNCGANVGIWDSNFKSLDYERRRVHDSSVVASAPIIIGDDAFIGANVIIMKGVSIGQRSIVGAGSVVTKSIPDDEIWAGNPAKFIRKV
jgi:acetyltransferase-like isoleucine patch superfamily enzyme